VDNVYFYDTIGRGYDGTHGVGKTQVVAVSSRCFGRVKPPGSTHDEHGPVSGGITVRSVEAEWSIATRTLSYIGGPLS
jgi:hypothetical protein